MTSSPNRREFLRDLGLSTAALPFLLNLPSIGFANQQQRKQRLVVMFSPNGIVPKTFWPDEEGDKFTLKESVQPLEPLKNRTLFLHGIGDKVRGDGDSHMRGIGCLLTGVELYPGNVLGGCTEHPAGWSKGVSIDQELKTHLQKNPATRTRFGSLEFGVCVPERADTWTRMVYSGPNKPVTPVSNPYHMLNKLYASAKHQQNLKSILDGLQQDFKKVESLVSVEDRRLLEEHATFVREFEQELKSSKGNEQATHAVPQLPLGIKDSLENMPQISKLQVDLLVNSFAADFSRIATLQYNHSTSDATMPWIKVDGRHHDLSHKPDDDIETHKKLTQIDRWYCEQLVYLAQRLADTPEPGGPGSLLDNTLIIWSNELGQGNSHTLDNIPFVLVGGGLNFKMGRSLKYKGQPHNRLLLSLAHGFGHSLKQFGNPNYCADGPLPGLA
ncbi:MAG: DUF1552 domain-containing protein [Planctomycetales bacterium]